MDLAFQVSAHVSRTPREAFEGVADPEQLSRYFTTGGARGRIETGATVTWDFADFPGAFPVEIVEAEPARLIRLRWDSSEPGADYKTEVTIAFEAVDDGARTKVTISERGWPDTAAALKASYGNCMGWSQMLAALKAWLEHGLNLREGMYK